VARSSKTGTDVVYSGEVWTDARGFATVAVPGGGQHLKKSFEYELRPFTRGVNASIAAELIDGRFTIETNEPHVKVAWRIRGPASAGRKRSHEEEIQ
jgi:hypothetical protein